MLTAVEAPVRISVASVQPHGGNWLVAWEVTNLSDEPLVLEDAWVPHGRFRGDGHTPLDVHIDPGQSSRITLTVTAHEPAGTVVENAFLILRVSRRWRVFARMRVVFDAAMPRPIVEAVTLQSLQSKA